MTHKLSLIGVCKEYGEVVALKPTSLDVDAGEFLTLLGPSGSGKTTLLQLVAGLLAPTAGEIFLDGKPTSRAPPHKRDIGLVFQNYALFPHLTAAENIAFPLRMRRVDSATVAKRVGAMLDLVQLPQVADRFPAEMSGGQQQRIALARAAVYEPSVILMDEPLGALDKALREDMQAEIKRIHRELGATILYVTHDQEEAMAMSDRICLMRDGSIEQIGTPGDLYFAPRSVFAATFLGHSNILAGTLTGRDGDRATVKLAFGPEIAVRDPAAAQAIGSDVRILVRPESVVSDGGSGVVALDARLEHSVIVGSLCRRHWRLPDGTAIAEASLTAPRHGSDRAGDAGRIGWLVDSAILLERGEA